MVSRTKTFGRSLESALMDGISTLITAQREVASFCSPPCKDTARAQPSTNLEAYSHKPAGALILDFPTSRSVRNLRTQGGRGKLRQSESSMDIYTLPNVKQLASRKQQHSTGRSARCFVTTQRGGIGRGYGDISIWLIYFGVQQKLTQYCEAFILQ